MSNLTDLGTLVGQYRAGLEAEMTILRRIAELARDQHRVSGGGDLAALPTMVEERDRLMATLVSIEAGLKPIRARLSASASQLAGVVEFQQVKQLHLEAADLAAAILSDDERSLEALKEAEVARRAVAQALEQGESTLAAYRRVTVPAPSPATLVNRRG